MLLGIRSLWLRHIDKCNAKCACLKIKFVKGECECYIYQFYEMTLCWWQLSPHVKWFINMKSSPDFEQMVWENTERDIFQRPLFSIKQLPADTETNPALTWQGTANETRLKQLSSDPDPDRNQKAADSWFWSNDASKSIMSYYVQSRAVKSINHDLSHLT